MGASPTGARYGSRSPARGSDPSGPPRPPDKRSRRRRTWRTLSEQCPSPPPSMLARRDVLVEAEDVLGVVAALKHLEPVVLLQSVGLADPLLPLVHEEVHVHAGVVRLEGRPEPAHPLPLLVEAL